MGETEPMLLPPPTAPASALSSQSLESGRLGSLHSCSCMC